MKKIVLPILAFSPLVATNMPLEELRRENQILEMQIKNQELRNKLQMLKNSDISSPPPPPMKQPIIH